MTDKMYRELRALRDSIDRILQHAPNSPTHPYSFNATTSYVQTRWWEPPKDNVTFTYYPRTTTAGKR